MKTQNFIRKFGLFKRDVRLLSFIIIFVLTPVTSWFENAHFVKVPRPIQKISMNSWKVNFRTKIKNSLRKLILIILSLLIGLLRWIQTLWLILRNKEDNKVKIFILSRKEPIWFILVWIWPLRSRGIPKHWFWCTSHAGYSRPSKDFTISLDALKCWNQLRLNSIRNDSWSINGSLSSTVTTVKWSTRSSWRASTELANGFQRANSTKIWCSCWRQSTKVTKVGITLWDLPWFTIALT